MNIIDETRRSARKAKAKEINRLHAVDHLNHRIGVLKEKLKDSKTNHKDKLAIQNNLDFLSKVHSTTVNNLNLSR